MWWKGQLDFAVVAEHLALAGAGDDTWYESRGEFGARGNHE